jgi:hypothetical protein
MITAFIFRSFKTNEVRDIVRAGFAGRKFFKALRYPRGTAWWGTWGGPQLMVGGEPGTRCPRDFVKFGRKYCENINVIAYVFGGV